MTVPNYTPPTRAEFKAILGRTLRDEDHVIFTGEMLNDFIDEAIADLNGYRPMENIETIAYAPDLNDPNATDIVIQPEVVSYIYQVEVRNTEARNDPYQSVSLPYHEPESSPMRNGWDFFHGRVRLGRVNWNMLWGWSKAINGPLDFILFGYEDRQLPATDGDILDFWDTIDYVCTLRYCRMLSFQMLNNDRALYQQWLASTNNTDVSPTQLQGMLNQAQNEVDRQRKRNLLIRRTVVHGPQYI